MRTNFPVNLRFEPGPASELLSQVGGLSKLRMGEYPMRNASLHCIGLAVVLIAGAAAWSQSSAVPDQKTRAHGLQQEILRRFGPVAAKVVRAQGHAQPESKSSYKFSIVDFPGSSQSFTCDAGNGEIIGNFADPLNSDLATAFILKGNVEQRFVVPGLNGSQEVLAISTTGEMVGAAITPPYMRSLEIINGQATIFDPPQAVTDEATGVNASGVIVGNYYDADNFSHGYMYSGGQFTYIDYPGGTYTVVNDINSAGEIVGYWIDTSDVTHGFLLKNGKYTSIDVPQSNETLVTGINDKGQIVGAYGGSDGAGHGFLYSNGVFQSVDIPRAAETLIFRVKNNGELLGAYFDDKGEAHAFVSK